jgi:hypothetical protein
MGWFLGIFLGPRELPVVGGPDLREAVATWRSGAALPGRSRRQMEARRTQLELGPVATTAGVSVTGEARQGHMVAVYITGRKGVVSVRADRGDPQRAADEAEGEAVAAMALGDSPYPDGFLLGIGRTGPSAAARKRRLGGTAG